MVAATGAKRQIQRIRLRATGDVDQSRRAMRILFVNWLAQVDKPPKNPAPIAVEHAVLIYAADPTARFTARAVSPDGLIKAIEPTSLAREIFVVFEPGSNGGTPAAKSHWEGNGFLARERRNRAFLIVKLAAELYRRERGKAPARAGALVGPYLKSLPEEFASNAPIPERAE
jgi:hypothetical protein